MVGRRPVVSWWREDSFNKRKPRPPCFPWAATSGLYGVVVYAVSQRTREIGVRMALGARPGDVLWMVLARGLRITGIGVIAGLVLSAVTVRLMRAYLYGLSPFDPIAFLAARLASVAIAMLAIWYPSRRATRIDPITALQYE